MANTGTAAAVEAYLSERRRLYAWIAENPWPADPADVDRWRAAMPRSTLLTERDLAGAEFDAFVAASSLPSDEYAAAIRARDAQEGR